MAKNQCDSYFIKSPNKVDWGHFVVDEKIGAFYANTTFGNYSHIWYHRGEGVSLKKFLSKLGIYYFAKKTSKDYEVFDEESTIINIKQRIIRDRRENSIAKQQAKLYWENITQLADPNSYLRDESYFLSLMYYEYVDLWDYLGYDCDYIRKKLNPIVVGFWEHLWGEFLTEIKSELE